MAETKQTAVYTPRLKALYNDTYTKELQHIDARNRTSAG